MFTLFWAGDVFAPNHRFEGQSIQHILQSSFINSFKHLAERLQDLKNVIGFEVMVKRRKKSDGNVVECNFLLTPFFFLSIERTSSWIYWLINVERIRSYRQPYLW